MPLTDAVPSLEASAAPAAHVRATPAPLWIAMAAVVPFIVIASQVRIGLSLRDEGFLWYGAQRVLQGELPLRDFQAYDPGRYLWAAMWMVVLGDDGIVALRLGNALLAAATVALAIWTVASGSRRPAAAAILSVCGTFTLWLVPHFKIADAFAATLLLFGLARLIRRPGIGRCVQGGTCLGLASTIGVNHALYGSVAALLGLFYLRGVLSPARAVPAAIAGGVAGYAPVLALHLLAPGFTAAFLDGVVQLSEYGATNLPLPFPDLLAVVRTPEAGLLHTTAQTLSALLFLCVPPLWLWAAWRLRRAEVRAALNPAIPAGLILSVPYAHYAYSRADLVHIAVSILPLLAAALAWALGTASPVRRRLILASVFGLSLAMTAREHPAYHALRNDRMVVLAIDGAGILVGPDDAAEIRAARSVAAAAGPGAFFAGPYLPGAYALARRRSPVWEIYMLFPASPARQRAEIARLKASNVRHALIAEERVDGRPDLGLERTHPLLLAYLRRRLDKSIKVRDAPLMTIRTSTRPAHPSRGSDVR